ncbi:MAG: fibronectin type III domain-containing protein, partial [Elusimicrobia bacterium]|nr:fibronectin type III domain-containing protein [Elusimicrobiota bacterium]
DWLTDTEYENNEDGTFTPALNIKPNYGVILIRKDAGNFYQWGTVTGTVSELDPGTKAIVSIDAPDGVSCSAWTVETDESGYYEITRVITGTRYIRWWAPGKRYEGASFSVGTGYTPKDITLADDSVAPAAPTGFSAKGKDGGIDLGWNKNTEDDFESYIIQYALSPTGPWNWCAECLGNVFYFNGYDPDNKYYDTGLTNGTTYYFRICARDRNGNQSDWSDVISAVPHKTSTKFWVDVRQTSYYPDNISKVQIAGNSQALGYAEDKWNAMDMTSNGNGSYEITLEHSPEMIVQYKYIIVDNQGNSVWENDFGDSPDDNNREIAISDGNSTQIVANVFNSAGDVAPAAPESVTVATSSGVVYLGWKQNIEPDISGYYIERSTYSSTAGFQFLSNAAAQVVTYTDSGLKNGNTYYYRMKAYDKQNNYSDFSSPVSSGCPNPGDSTPPSMPTNLYARGAGTSGAKILWRAATEADTAGYNVYRGTFSSFAPEPASRLNSALVSKSLSPSYTDLTAATGATYYYKITSVDNSLNESAPSAALGVFLSRVSFFIDIGAVSPQSVSVFGYPEPLFSSGGALAKRDTYTWTGSLVFPAGEQIYYKYRYDDQTEEGDFDTTSRYREFEVGFKNISRADDWEEKPSAPENLSAYPLSGGVWLDWSENTANEDLIGYKVFYSTDANNFNFEKNEIISETEYTLTGLTNGTSYFVIVRSVDGGNIKLESENAFTSFALPKEPVFVKFVVASGADGFDSLEKYISVQSGLDTSAWLDRGNIARQSSSLIQALVPGATYNYLLFVKTGASPSNGLSSYNWYYDCVPASGEKIPTSTSSTTITGYTAEYLSVSPSYDARRVLWIPDTLSAYTTYYVFNNFASTPSAPSSVQAIPDGKDAVVLSWQPPYGFWGSGSEEYKAADVIAGGKYLIYRSSYSASSGFNFITSVNGSSFTYRDTGLTENNTYYYILVSSDCYSGKNMIENRYSVFSSTVYARTRGKIPCYFKVKRDDDKEIFETFVPADRRKRWFAFAQVFLPGAKD